MCVIYLSLCLSNSCFLFFGLRKSRFFLLFLGSELNSSLYVSLMFFSAVVKCEQQSLEWEYFRDKTVVEDNRLMLHETDQTKITQQSRNHCSLSHYKFDKSWFHHFVHPFTEVVIVCAVGTKPLMWRNLPVQIVKKLFPRAGHVAFDSQVAKNNVLQREEALLPVFVLHVEVGARAPRNCNGTSPAAHCFLIASNKMTIKICGHTLLRQSWNFLQVSAFVGQRGN